MTIEGLLQVLCDVEEYAQLPVRHNEDQLNTYVTLLEISPHMVWNSMSPSEGRSFPPLENKGHMN